MGNSKDKFLEIQEREARNLWEQLETRMNVIAQNGNDGFHYEDLYNYQEAQRPFVPERKDTVVESVIDKYRERSETGIKKYGTTLDRSDLNLSDWLTHLQEELMDATLYVEKLKKSFGG